jgi:hypothetical protein
MIRKLPKLKREIERRRKDLSSHFQVNMFSELTKNLHFSTINLASNSLKFNGKFAALVRHSASETNTGARGWRKHLITAEIAFPSPGSVSSFREIAFHSNSFISRSDNIRSNEAD